MERSLRLLPILVGILLLGSCVGIQASKNFTSITLETDYYRVSVNHDGSLNFTNRTTGASILDSSPAFYCNFGATTVSDVTPVNSSFEIDDNKDGVPDGWAVDKARIRQSSEAFAGAKSLEFRMTSPDPSQGHAYSSLITVGRDKEYSVSLQARVRSFTVGASSVFVSYYSSPVGAGPLVLVRLVTLPTKAGEWTTYNFTWRPPFDAKSFKVLLYTSADTVADILFDDVVVTESIRTYQSNGHDVKTSLLAAGDDVTVDSVDDSNPSLIVSYEYNLNLHSPKVKCTCLLTYKQNVTVTEERLDFSIPSHTATVMTRDLLLNDFDVAKEYYSDYYTPKVVRFDNGLSFLANDTMQSMRLRANGVYSLLSYYLDFDLNHPFTAFIKNGSGATTDLSAQERRSGTGNTASVTFIVDPTTTTKSLVKARQPDGYDAVLVFTNHPDDETTARISAVAYGTDDTASPDYGTRGIVGRGLGWTKAVFLSGVSRSYSALSDTAFKVLTDRLRHDGVEIVGHTITPNTDSRGVVEGGMKILAQYGARNWIDHSASDGANNWEDLASQGTFRRDDNYVLDLFDKYGYAYAWSYIDYPTSRYDLNQLSPRVENAKTPFFYYNRNVDDNPSDDKRIFLWSTLYTQKLVDLYYTSANVDKLITERGVHIGHDYVGNQLAQNHAWFVNPSNGRTEIFPYFDDELAYIGSKRDAGLLWTPTMAEFGDYLLLLDNVEVDNLSGDTYMVANLNSVSVKGVTLLSEKKIQSVTLNGAPLKNAGGSFSGIELVLPEIPVGGTVFLSISY